MRDIMLHATEVANVAELHEFMDRAGVVGPSLHPHVDSEDSWRRWNGWNAAIAVGMDSTGIAVVITKWYYASSRSSPSLNCSVHGQTPRGGRDDDFVFAEVSFPLRLLGPGTVINHPEHTPRREEQQ